LEHRGQISTEYAAGFFDGEGTVYIHGYQDPDNNRRYHAAKISISQKTPAVLYLFQERWGGRVRIATKDGTYVWEANGDTALSFVSDIYPYTIVKYEQLRLYLEFKSLRKAHRYAPVTEEEWEQREWYRSRIKELKKEGVT
jgi:hypothetical protein